MRTWRMLRQMTLVQFKLMLRNPIALVFNLAVPIAFLILFGALFGGQDVAPHIKIGLVDNDRGALSQQFQQFMSAGFDIVSVTEANMTDQVQKGIVQAAVVLPAGLGQQVAAGQAPGQVTVTYDPSSQVCVAAYGQVINLVGRLNGTIQQAKPVMVVKGNELPATAHLVVMDYLMPGELGFMLLNANIVSVVVGLASARQGGTLRHQFSTPLTPGVWLAGRVAANLLTGLVQCAVIIVTGILAFHAKLPSNLAGTLAILVVSVLATAGIGLAIGSLFRNVESAMPVSIILSMGMAFLGNSMMPIDNAPQLMQSIAKLLPSWYITHALRMVMMQGQALGTVTLDLLILAGWALVLIVFGSWNLRREATAA